MTRMNWYVLKHEDSLCLWKPSLNRIKSDSNTIALEKSYEEIDVESWRFPFHVFLWMYLQSTKALKHTAPSKHPRPVINKSKPNFWCISLYHAACKHVARCSMECLVLFRCCCFFWGTFTAETWTWTDPSKWSALEKGGFSYCWRKVWIHSVFAKFLIHWTLENSWFLAVRNGCFL